MKHRILASCLATLLPLMAAAEPEPWMARTDPVTLPYLAYAKVECPISNARVTSLVERLLVDAGLRPERAWPFPNGMFLRAKVECIEFQPDAFAFVTTIGFGHLEDGRMVFECYDSGDIGVVTRANATFILESLEMGVEYALSDYVEANFDVEPTSGDALPQSGSSTRGRDCSSGSRLAPLSSP